MQKSELISLKKQIESKGFGVRFVDFSLEKEEKDPDYQPDFNLPDKDFVKSLYKNMLKMEVSDDDSGLQHWCKMLESEVGDKNKIYNFFRKTAIEENQKNKKVDIKTLIPDTDKKKVFFVIKESIGDCFIISSILESLRENYPQEEYFINIVTEPKYFDIFRPNPNIDNLVPYHPLFEQEMAVIGAGDKKENAMGDVYIFPAVSTQRFLNYLSNSNIGKVKCD